MTDDRRSGVALIAGSVGGMITMAIHPTGGGALTRPEIERLAAVSGAAHTLAMVSFLVLFLGAIGLTWRLAAGERPGRRDRLALAGLTIYGFAAVAVLLATAVSGFIVPRIMLRMIRDTAVNAPQWRIVIDAVFQFNQAFAGIYSVAASGAILAWSVSMLRKGGLGRGVAIYGCILAPVLIGLIGIGHLRLDVHGMAVVVLAQAAWFVMVGAQLWRMPLGQNL